MNKVTSNITFENAQIVLKDFRGTVSQMNRNGERTFGVLLDDAMAEQLAEDGWNIKYFKPSPDDPDQYRQPWMKVKVRFDKFPPTAVMITSKGKVKLDEENIVQLDAAYFKYVDLVVSPYNYPAFNGNPAGVSAYLKAIYVTIMEDDLTLKYQDVPDIDDVNGNGYASLRG